MISGNIGSESLLRLDYTVIGNVVNTAARYQDVACEGQIIIDDIIYEQVKDMFHCSRIGETRLKNKEQPVIIYTVEDIK